MYTKVKTAQEIESMRSAGNALASVLELLRGQIAPGLTTKDLSNIAEKELAKLGVEPAFLGYQGFPEVLCVSVNEEVVHGIPNKNRVISSGDIVSMDLGVRKDGMVVDGAISVLVDSDNKDLEKFLRTTQESLAVGLKQIRSGCRVGDIGEAIQAVLDRNNYGIVRDLVGHGVGHQIHEDPNIPNFGKKGTGPILEEGMTIAVEPMATLGVHNIYVDSDGWTVKTKDHSLACHFEHTILVTKSGCEVLTTL